MWDVLAFIFYTSFNENRFFFLLIAISFTIFFRLSIVKNNNRFTLYEKNTDTFMLDDYSDGIPSPHVSGILMSIGIIGTFFLIYDSLSNLTGVRSNEMIGVISHDIAPAFSISALGIFASIFYVLSEKIFILGVYKNRIKNLEEEYTLNSYSKTIKEDRKIAKEMLEATKKQTEILLLLRSSSHSEALNPEIIGSIIGRAINDEMQPILKNMYKVMERVEDNNRKFITFLEEDLKYKILVPLIKSVESTDNSMKEMKIVLEKTTDVMNETSKGIGKISENLTKLEELQIDFVKNLDETTKKITSTYSLLNGVISKQIDKFNENSTTITDSFTKLSTDMQTFLVTYKKDYQKMLKDTGEKSSELITKASETLQTNLKDVNDTLLSTATQASDTITTAGATASSTISTAGTAASTLITNASGTLQGTLDGVKKSLVDTSDKVQDELKKFREDYTESLKKFLGTQAEQLEEVFGENTEKLKQVVIDFKDVLEEDTLNRTELNEDLEKLIKTTNIFVNSTKLMITTAFNEQESQLTTFMKNNQSMQSKLNNIVNNNTIAK